MLDKQLFSFTTNRATVTLMSSNERLTDTIPAIRVSALIGDLIRDLSKRDRRELVDVARALLERGAAAYRKDGLLFEPEPDEQTEASTTPGNATTQKPSDTITTPHVRVTKKLTAARRGTG